MPGSLLTSNFPDSASIEADVIENGFAVYEDALDKDALREMKSFWSDYFARPRPRQQVRRGNMRLGEETFTGFTDDAEHCLYRDVDFLWNQPTHAGTRELGQQLHRVRNRAQQLEADAGFAYSADNYGVYIATSCYPAGTGWMRAHSDGHQDRPILQYMVNFTHRGIDYEEGGLYVHRADGTKVDVDARMAPGSIAFFDGQLRHGVDTIRSNSGAGHIASFAITTFFRTRAGLPEFLRRAEDMYFSAESRVARLRARVAL